MPTADLRWDSWRRAWALAATLGVCYGLLAWGPIAVTWTVAVIGGSGAGIRAAQLGGTWGETPETELRNMVRHCFAVGAFAASSGVTLAVVGQASPLLALSCAGAALVTTPPALALARRGGAALALHGVPGQDFVDRPVRFRR